MTRRYTSPDEDSGRWSGFAFRDGDIIVSTRSKHGTTWVQMILLLLIHQRPDLPAPLAELAPWLDHLIEPKGRRPRSIGGPAPPACHQDTHADRRHPP